MITLLKEILAVELIHQELSSVIIIPDQENSIEKGRVVLSSPNVEHVEVGDIVYFSHRTGQDFKYEGKDLLIMNEEELVGFEKGEE